MTEKRLLPHIRFSGFSHNWEKEKIVNIIEIYSGLTYKPEDIQKFGTLVLRSSNVKDGKIINCNNVYVSPSVVNSKNVQKNDIVLVVRNGSKNLIGKHALINADMKNTVIGAFMSGLRSENGLFVNALLDTVTFKREVFKSLGATINQITNKDLRSMAFLIPKTCEQQKIGNLFAKLDRLLDLQQQKLDQLELLKKALLQKLFPKQGTEIPELRFKGFEDEWKQEQFSYLYKKRSEKNDLTFGPDRIISVANMYFKQTETRSDKKYMKTYNVFRIGDIAFEGHKSKRFSFGRFVENTIGDGIVSHVFEVFRPITSYDLNYWKYAIHNEDFMGPILRRSTIKATMMNNLIEKDFLKQKITVPKLSEQQKIGNLLAKVDHLIEVENKKLNNLKLVKKSLLQNMFVE